MTQNGSSGEKITKPKQDELISLLLAGVHIGAAAKQAGIGERTAFRWLKEESFQRAYRDAKQAIFSEVLERLMDKVGKAIDTLDRNMNAEDVPPAVQVRAAAIVIEQAITLHKTEQLEDALSDMQEFLKEHNKGGGYA